MPALVCENRADHHAGHILRAGCGVAGHALVRVSLDARLAILTRIHDVEHRPQHGILRDHFDRSTGDVSDVGVFREEQRTWVAGLDQRVLQAGF